MAVSLLTHVISDLCLGKPALRSLPLTATVAEALSALKNTDDNFLSDNNLVSPAVALESPVSVLLPEIPGLVMHVDPSSSLLEAIDLIIEGAQNLVVPIKTRVTTSRRKHQAKVSATLTGLTTIHDGGREFCWLAQEDIVRFLLSSIGLFSPIPALSIDTLGIITTEIFTITYNSPASAALEAISTSLATQTSVAVVDGEEGVLIGELSPSTLACCDETVAAAITTLSAGDLMAYIDCGGPPEDLVRVVMARCKQRGLEAMLEEFTKSSNSLVSHSSFSSSSSSDEESVSRRYSRSMSYSARMGRRAEAIVCHPKSSLVAVMIQAIAHRVNYVWVVEDDCSLVGIVTFCNMLEVFREHLESLA
ncbi:CBS domain-containing protein CBSX5 isoform X2 [Euphorbia lathyris]|uniref:CBS domain-containing protein CBSX5 isoform X2 n=1 Tax=Euphorbia lathyris TaxID=212925 RepID=UPI003313E692